MRNRRLKRGLALLAVALGALLLAGVRPALHFIRTARRDVGDNTPAAPGTANDASRLNETPVEEIWAVPEDRAVAEQQLAALLERARAQHLKVSIAGARHSMGGHTIAPEGIVIDMLPFHYLELDRSKMILHVQAGARWSQVITFLNAQGCSVEVMQSNDDFSVGGSLSVNCHGWQFNHAPICSTVESFRLMLADGRIVKCSRSENSELFSLVLGGYGLFGIILDADLHVVPNEWYRIERLVVRTDKYAATLKQKTQSASDIAMVYGRLRLTQEKFLEEGTINLLHWLPASGTLVSALGDPKEAELKRLVFRGSEGSDYGKKLRWEAETSVDSILSGSKFERNQLLYEPVALFQNRGKATTDILMECFVPPEQFEPFLGELRHIVPKCQVDLMNVTVRDVRKDPDTVLRYADQDMYALVMLFSQRRDAQGESRMGEAAQEIISAALRHQGRYYLPYRLHATVEQFARAYPRASEFFEAKRRYDPEELFQNGFYLKYGKALRETN